MIASALGSYPRIGEGAEAQGLRRAIQKFQAGGLSKDELRRVEDEVVGEAISEQENAGLDWVTDGLVRWEDSQTYFADRMEGFRRGQLIRYFDTNTYYRQPVAVGAIRWKEPITVADYRFATSKTAKPVRPIVTGPYTLARLSEDEHYKSFEAFASDVAAALSEEIRALEGAGAKRIQIDEPALVTSPGDEALARKLFERAVRDAKAEIWLALYMGSPTALLDRVSTWPAAGVWLDCVSDSATLDRLSKQGWPERPMLGLGVVDARNTRLESADALRDTLARVTDRVPAERLAATTSAGLEFLPRQRAAEKLARLAQAAHAVGATAAR